VNSLNILISAYACRPGEGSEPGVGWHIVRELAKYHNISVLTRESNRSAIEAVLSRGPISNLKFIYCDTPAWLRGLNKNQRLVHLHYYYWQIKAFCLAKQLHQSVRFDLIHHVTYVRYSTPSFLTLLPAPFIWGPVGGGESAPYFFWRDFSWRGKLYEVFRLLARQLGELDPFVGLTARRSVLVRATTAETAQCLCRLGAKQVEIVSQLGLSEDELAQLAVIGASMPEHTRFISIGRLLHWKGFHLGLQAFAQANLPEDAEYWIVGEGPERSRLEALANTLGIGHQVKFWNKLTREETLSKLGECMALVHPSLHESGGFVCIEAMAARRPVICLDLGGPGLQVTPETGIKVLPHTLQQTIQDLAKAMSNIACQPDLRLSLSTHGVERVHEVYAWKQKAYSLAQKYEELTMSTKSPA
jgi:glycosyltransferase involved in cell wall biosynthesis